MRFLNSPKPVVAIVGPTAVGKTELSLQLAMRLNGEIISADSRLFYRGMDIGTAKPTGAEMESVPHHLIDIANPDETVGLASFQEAAVRAIGDIQARGQLPFLVGGTGQYFWSVVEDWQIPVQEPDLRLRKELERWAGEIGAEAIYNRLKYVDPPAAAHIEYRNVRRTVRALEVIFRTGRRFSEQRKKGASPFDWLIIGITRPRNEVFARIDARIDEMLAEGFEAEVSRLLDQGYSEDLPSLSAIGYREMATAVRGEIEIGEAAIKIKSQTHRFVRRQANWFKQDDPRIHWFRAGPGAADEIENYIRDAEVTKT